MVGDMYFEPAHASPGGATRKDQGIPFHQLLFCARTTETREAEARVSSGGTGTPRCGKRDGSSHRELGVVADRRLHGEIVVLYIFMNFLRRTCRERRRIIFQVFQCNQISYIFDPVRWLMPQLACPDFTPVPPTGRDRRAFCIFCACAGVQRGAPPMSFLLHSYPTAASSALTLCFCSVRSLFLRFWARSGLFEFFKECSGACGRCSAWRGCTPIARTTTSSSSWCSRSCCSRCRAAAAAASAASAVGGARLPPWKRRA